MPKNPGLESADEPQQKAVRDGLAAILDSAEFQGAGRLKDFLSYVIDEDLSGRAKNLRAKTIAVDVYDRLAGDADAENLVRVDAGRLRRRLAEYYAGSGKRDRVRIHIDRGGYVPRYSIEQPPPSPVLDEDPDVNTASKASWLTTRNIALAIGAVVIIFEATFALTGNRGRSEPPEPSAPTGNVVAAPASDQKEILTRTILFEEDPARLQARNLVVQGRSMLLPAPEHVRLEAALSLFERAILLDPEYVGGYSGAALALGMLGVLTPPGTERSALVQMSEAHAADAMRIDATDPESLTAHALAAFAGGNDDLALDSIGKAVALAPRDRQVRDYEGLISLFVGNLDQALDATNPDLHAGQPNERLAWRNVRAVASYLSGQPDDAIRLISEGAALGDPVSIINHAFLAASFQATGQTKEAQETIARFERAWPDTNLSGMLTLLFRNPEHVQDVLGALQEAGWTAGGAD